MWIRKNDTVVMIRGEDRGSRGKVLRVVTKGQAGIAAAPAGEAPTEEANKVV